jgi:hypothetical protein
MKRADFSNFMRWLPLWNAFIVGLNIPSLAMVLQDRRVRQQKVRSRCTFMVDVCMVDVCMVDVCMVDVCIVDVCIVGVCSRWLILSILRSKQ